ncbi:unnamed protein product [Hymenolepis diminuta]|uniref:ALMS_motif domain-containing protein n=1 Tax=Hymenolepis diminuta TaxID=6216 RepID=A0A0R3SYS2_HYMDI|nr:unnamed protein product [Hymenolepis diminuta]
MVTIDHNMVSDPSNESLPKLTLQEAFRQRMQAFITRSEARQRLIRLEALERRLKSERKGLKPPNDSNNNIRSSISLPSSLNHPKCWGSASSKKRYIYFKKEMCLLQ